MLFLIFFFGFVLVFFWLGVGGGGVLAREIKLLAKQFQCAFILQHTSLDSRKYNMMLRRKKERCVGIHSQLMLAILLLNVSRMSASCIV